MEKSNGNCYICGKESKPVAMKNHILKSHCAEGDEPCYLVLMESVSVRYYYWLIADVALDKSLSSVDAFLRKIWLECCGHLSEFIDMSDGTVGKASKIKDFCPGEKIVHLYDFGTTTGVRITFLAKTVRPKQRAAVRLLARNVPPAFKCISCGETAELVCCECGGMYDGSFFCEGCFGEHDCKYKNDLPITNSPRCGECGYCGTDDTFEFRPDAGRE